MADQHWDEDYFIEVSSCKIPEEPAKIRGIGRGKLNVVQDISSLRLPKAATVKTKENKSTAPQGRGRGELRSFLSHGPARLPKDKNTRKDFVGLHSTSHFPSLQSVAASTRQSPKSSSPKTSIRHKKTASQPVSSAATAFICKDTDSNWPSLTSVAKSSKKTTQDLHSFARSCKNGARNGDSPKSTLPKRNTSPDNSQVIVIQNLPDAILAEDLQELLQLYGHVVACDIERDNQGNSLGCAIVSMGTKAECEWIISCFHDEEYPGCTGLGKLSCTFLS